MTFPPRHSRIRNLLGAYAVNAVEPGESRGLDKHLAKCASCRAEVDEHRRALAELTESDLAPPEGVWSKIESALASERRQRAALRVPQEAPPRIFGLRLASAAAVVSLVAIGLLGQKVVSQDRQIAELRQRTSEQRLLRAAALASADPSSDRITMRSPDESLTVRAVLQPDGKGYLVGNNLGSPDAKKAYVLWALVDKARVALGAVNPQDQVVEFRAPAKADGLAITQEDSPTVVTSS
jgi:anti-sigma-K factor RskA